MNKSILIELLSRFSPREIKEFDEYIKSPFFNKNQSVISLFNYLRKHYPLFDKAKIEKRNVFSSIFPGVEYNDGFMRTLMFNLCSLAENYLSYECYKNNYFMGKKFLLCELNNRELDRLFEKNYKAVSKHLKDEPIKDEDYFYLKYNIDFEKMFYLYRKAPDKNEKIIPHSNVAEVFDNLTYYYLIRSIDHYLYFLNVMELYKFRFETEKIEKILEILKSDKFKDIPLLELYYNLLMLFLNEDEVSYFYNTLEILKNKEDSINKENIYRGYLNLKNYCKRKIQKEDYRFVKELFDIYKIELNKKVYSLQNEMYFRNYTGIIETALRLKEYKWAKDFIEKYKKELNRESRENTYTYALALYEFAMGNYEKSLELLSKVKYHDVYHKLKYRSLLVMLYYELDLTELLLSHVDSFNHFLLNDKMIKNERKIYYSNFLKVIKSVISFKENNKRNDIQLFGKKLNEMPLIYNKDWLKDKVNELID